MNTISLYHPDKNYVDALLPLFQAALPNCQLLPWSENVTGSYLITWKPEDKIFRTPELEVVFSLGAGIDAFLNAQSLPASVDIVRLEEAGMGEQMLEVALYAVLHYSRDMVRLNQAQRQQQWLGESTPKKHPFSTQVGIMGLGQLGGFVAKHLAALGYPVSGYSRSEKDLPNIQCFSGKQLDEFLAHSEVLINLMPLTAETVHFLNQSLFAKLPTGAYLVNIARGKHLVEADLIPALDSGQLSGAYLDVFETEPLPVSHDFWQDGRITITPHLAAITLPDEAVKQISRNILAHQKGEPMTGLVNRERGY